VRLPEAIDRGWLLPFHYFGIADETVELLRIPWRRLDEVKAALSVEVRVDRVVRHALERGFDGPRRATIGVCAGVEHARFIYVDDPLEWVFVADILNEGVDIPAVNSVLFLRPTESVTLFLQQLGRGLRLCPGAEVLTVLDFVGHHRSAWLTLQALHAPQGARLAAVVALRRRERRPTSASSRR
jgi:superfamily II DNA or RNA helicase